MYTLTIHLAHFFGITPQCRALLRSYLQITIKEDIIHLLYPPLLQHLCNIPAMSQKVYRNMLGMSRKSVWNRRRPTR